MVNFKNLLCYSEFHGAMRYKLQIRQLKKKILSFFHLFKPVTP